MTTVLAVADCCVRLIALQRLAADVFSVSAVVVVLVVILVLVAGCDGGLDFVGGVADGWRVMVVLAVDVTYGCYVCGGCEQSACCLCYPLPTMLAAHVAHRP